MNVSQDSSSSNFQIKINELGCIACGTCCRESGDYIPMTFFDLMRMSNMVDLDDFINSNKIRMKLLYMGSIGGSLYSKRTQYRYSVLIDGWVPITCLYLPCHYLKGNECSIHNKKPLICISFPYHLPILSKDSHCPLIRKLSTNKKNVKIPNRSKKAISLYPLALTATIYQFNLPIYSLNKSNNNLTQQIGFREQLEKIEKIPSLLASPNQIRSWVKKHFTEFIGRDNEIENLFQPLKSTIISKVYDENIQKTNISLIEKLSKYHYISEKEARKMIKYFL